MSRSQSGSLHRASVPVHSSIHSGLRLTYTRKSSSTSKQPQQNQDTANLQLYRRERLRIVEKGEDVTPRNLYHPGYPGLEERRTAFDVIGLATTMGSRTPSASHINPTLASLATVSSSFSSSTYTTEDTIIQPGHTDSCVSTVRLVDDAATDDQDVPSQFHLPRLDLREFKTLDERVTLRLRETETWFLFELPQLTELADTEEGLAIAEENERYRGIMGGLGRKLMDAEAQTPQTYTKSRGTLIEREQRKNRATFVNNWVMYDTLSCEEASLPSLEHPEGSRFKLVEQMVGKQKSSVEPTASSEAAEEVYEEATRLTLRILASKRFEKAHKRFTGLMRQDPRDLSLDLVYGLELLWKHGASHQLRRPVSTFAWNPDNDTLLAVGYGPAKLRSHEDSQPDGLVLIWCAKNPSEPDRRYEFQSAVSTLGWSFGKPNFLTVGLYNGTLCVVDVSKSQLTIVRMSERKSSPSYDPHWQAQWWPLEDEPVGSQQMHEQLYTSNQDGRVYCYSDTEEFAAREIFRAQRLEGKIPGVRRVVHSVCRDVTLSRSPGALLLHRHPSEPGVYLVGTEEGCVVRCSIAQPHMQLASFLAHDGPIYSLEYSPFSDKLLLSCGADWTARVWAEGLAEPLLTFSTQMACVVSAAWSPRNSTIFASAVANKICIWDLRRKGHRPASITKSAADDVRLTKIEWTSSGEQLVAADENGNVYVYGIYGMPLPPFDQKKTLLEAVYKALLTKPDILKKLKDLGPPFNH